MNMSLQGRTCVVTGASGGFGSKLVTRFWLEGASLLLTARNAGSLEALVRTLPAAGCPQQKLVTFCGDLAEPNALNDLFAKAKSEFDALTILINNAAVQGPIGPLWTNNIQEWESTLRVNLLVPAMLCSLVLPWMLSNSYGKIINVSGGGATGARPYFTAYASAKAGLVRLTESLAQEVLDTGVEVNAIAPGAMDTAMSQQILRAGREQVGPEYEKLCEQLVTRELTIQRAVDLAVFLASSQSDGVNGRLISAVWDHWQELPQHKSALKESDIYTLRRIVPKDRGLDWD